MILAVLMGFGVLVQQDYALARDLQWRFWTSPVSPVPDMDEGPGILAYPAGLPDMRYINGNT